MIKTAQHERLFDLREVLPVDAQDMLRLLKDPMWRLCSGVLYKIMIKSLEDDESGSTEQVTILPFLPNDAQINFITRLWYRNLILKCRQLGFTTLIAIMWLDHALFNPNQRCVIVANNRESAEAIFRDKVIFAYDNLPDVLRDAFPIASRNASEILFEHNNSSIRVATSARGGTPHRLHISEFGKIGAEYPLKEREIITGSLPSVPLNGVTVIESTAEGRKGRFFKMSTKAQAAFELRKQLTKRDYRFHFHAWWTSPDYRMSARNVIMTPQDDEYFAGIEARIKRPLSPEQRAWYVATRENDFAGDETMMMQEYPSTPEEAFSVSTKGTYFATQLARARRENRIGKLQFDERARVNTFWDLGLNDYMTIWVHQRVGAEDHFLAYFEGAGEALAFYIRLLEDWARPRNVLWGKDHLPHDGAHRRPGSEALKTYEDMMHELGRKNTVIVPRIDDINRGIQLTRDKFHLAHFDEEGCKVGLDHLTAYGKQWNKQMAVWSDLPRHDEHSNGADSFRQWAQGYEGESTYQPINRSRAQTRLS